MPMLKTISGHTGLAGTMNYLDFGAKDTKGYLEKENRALATDLFGMNLPDGKGNWAERMDKTRERSGNNRSHRGQAATTYRHFIISPAEGDKCTLEELRHLVSTWVEREFGERGRLGFYEVAVVYHDDNSERLASGKEGIVHAHVIVNNTDLNTGGRMHISARQAQLLTADVQDIAARMGLTAFGKEAPPKAASAGKAGEDVEYLRIPDRGKHARSAHKGIDVEAAASAKRPRPHQDVFRTKAERALDREGKVSWKDVLRDQIDAACHCCRDFDHVVWFLKEVGIEVRPNSKGDDWLFYYPQPGVPVEDNMKRVSGSRLGWKYTQQGIEGKIAASYYHNQLLPDDRDDGGVRRLLAAVNRVQVKDGAYVVSKDIARAFSAIQGFKIANLADAKRELAHAREMASWASYRPAAKHWKQAVENIEGLLRVAELIPILPIDWARSRTQPLDLPRHVIAELKSNDVWGAPLEVRIERGWPLTDKEKASLTAEQRRAHAEGFQRFMRGERGPRLTGGGPVSSWKPTPAPRKPSSGPPLPPVQGRPR